MSVLNHCTDVGVEETLGSLMDIQLKLWQFMIDFNTRNIPMLHYVLWPGWLEIVLTCESFNSLH